MNLPKKALVLAAGFGSRMSPLTDTLPKPLLPIWNVPNLERILFSLKTWGVQEVCLNLHHQPQAVISHLMNRYRPQGLRISFSFEPEIAGTGGALDHARWFLTDPAFWIVNADIVLELDPNRLVETFHSSRPLASLWVTDSDGPRTVEVDHGQVRTFRSQQPGGPGTYTLCGVHLVSRKIFDHLTPGPSSIVDAFTGAIRVGRKVLGVSVRDSFWADIGTPESYIAAHINLQRRKGSALSAHPPSPSADSAPFITGMASIGANVEIGSGAKIEDSILMDGARIGARAHIRQAVIGRGAKVRGTVERMAVRASDIANPAIWELLRKLAWNINQTTVIPLSPRGSQRSFFRLQSAHRQIMAVVYDPRRQENCLYARNARFLTAIGVRVPGILIDIPAIHATAMEDLGDLSLQTRIQARAESFVLNCYRAVIEQMVRMHQGGLARLQRNPIPLSPPFSKALYRWERELFATQYLEHRLKLPPRIRAQALRELTGAATRLHKEPHVLIHRDLQSSNVLIHRGEYGFIDFQGMRLGPASYDLASLLCDPYVSLPRHMRDALVGHYASIVGSDPEHTLEIFLWAAVERLSQALGAYARLASQPQTAYFGRHILPGLKMLACILQSLDKCRCLQEIVATEIEQSADEGH